MSAHSAKSVLLNNASQAVTASQTNSVLSEVFSLSEADARQLVVDFNVSAITVVAAVTAKLQDSQDGTNWFDKKTLALTATGWKTIKITDADATNDAQWLPLRHQARLVVTTGVGDSVTVDAVIRSTRKSA